MTMTQATVTYDDVIKFITTEADYDQLRGIFDAGNARRKIVSSMETARKAATIKVATEVELSNLSPKYLNGLKGKVTEVDKNRVTVELDADSTARLEMTNQRRFRRFAADKAITIPGVPVSSCKF